MIRFQLLIGIIFLLSSLSGQFGDVKVLIDSRILKENDRRITADLPEQLKLFFETTPWDEEYSDLEIPLTIQLIFQGISDKGGERIYSAQCLFSNDSDQWYFAKLIQFPYSQGQGIVYSPVVFEPLASAIEYYALLILAGEADTYEPLGGTRFYERSREVALRGRSSLYSGGWSDRIDLVDLLSKNHEFRLAKFFFYEGNASIQEGKYAEAEKAFQKMLQNFKIVFDKYPRERYSIMFLDAHAPELAHLPPLLKNREKILKTLIEMDPDNEDTYKEGLGIKSE